MPRVIRASVGTTSLAIGLLVLALAVPVRAEDPAPTPEARALGFLAREVPLWSTENHCYSCHNNGDAARALYAARQANLPLPAEALADTTRWLTQPERWDHNGGDGPFSDKRLARLQFTAALAAAVAAGAGAAAERKTLVRAAERLTADQAADGAFLLEGGEALGTPATYGRALATRVLRDTLRTADPAAFRPAVDRAERWLVSARVESLLEAAAVLPIVSEPRGAEQPAAQPQRRHCLDLIARGQGSDGGWGPYARSPSEVFDTAVVVLSLVRFGQTSFSNEAPELQGRIDRGRAYLVASQNSDGSWTETTRPAGAVSYAQRLSTTGWATLALLATRAPARSAGR